MAETSSNSSTDRTITYIEHPSVEFVTDPKLLLQNLETVYVAYRQCYKSDPDLEFIEKKIQDDLYRKTLISAFRADTANLVAVNIAGSTKDKDEYNRQLTEREEYLYDLFNSDEMHFTRYLAICQFIKNHMNHESPLEHAVLSVHITDASRSWSIQQVRHRIAAISQMSQKYCGSHGKYIVPAAIRENEEALAVFKATIEHIEDSIAKLTDLNIPRDDVRMLLPNATETQMVFTANLREWMHICEERCCSRASWEINYISWAVLRYLQYHIPFVLSERGPKCLRLRRCPEDKPCGFYSHYKARVEI